MPMYEDPAETARIMKEIRETKARENDAHGLCICGRDLLPGFRFCDLCGAPVAYTGKTERLERTGPRITDYGRPSSPFWK